MAEIQETNTLPQGYSQLSQVRVPLDEAVDAFAVRDASGRIPIVVLPRQLNRIHNELVMLGLGVLIAGIAGNLLLNNSAWLWLGIVVALLLIALGVRRSFMVNIPEGVNGLLLQGGKYIRTIGSGLHIIPPWIVVSHLVTRREIPFDVPVVEALTQDNVRANVDCLVTFNITDPFRFIYNISAGDFDQVFQAVCQDALRSMIRHISSEQVINLAHQNAAELQAALSAEVEPYGVTVRRVNITYAQPAAEIVRLQEARQWAVLQRAEQVEKQALAQQRQADEETLARQRVMAAAEVEALRLTKLEERLRAYPLAAQYEWQSAQLAVAKSLAGNTRAVLQVGNTDDIVRALVMRDFVQSLPLDKADNGQGEPEEG